MQSIKTKVVLLVALFAYSAVAATCPSPLQFKTFSKSVNGEGVTVAVSVDVSAGYRLIGGGFTGQNLKESYVEDTTTPNWIITTGPVTADVGPGTTTAYAIGIYDPNNCYQVSYITSAAAGVNQQTGTASAVCPSGSTLVGGGGRTDRFLIENYPNTIRGSATSAFTWTASFASASGFVANSTTGVVAYAICLTAKNSGYSLGNFINNAGTTSNSNPPSSLSTNIFTIAGGGFLSNGLVSASFNTSGGWESVSSGYSTEGNGNAIQSLSIGLSQSVTSTTSAPTSSPTSSPTSAPTSAPTSSPKKTCSGEVITTARPASQSGSWVSGGTPYQIYDIGVKNTGQCPITRATYGSIFTGPNHPGVSQKWNIGNSPSGDQILGSNIDQVQNANGVAVGGTLNGAGVVVYNATGVTGVASGPSVFCDASCTNSN